MGSDKLTPNGVLLSAKRVAFEPRSKREGVGFCWIWTLMTEDEMPLLLSERQGLRA